MRYQRPTRAFEPCKPVVLAFREAQEPGGDAGTQCGEAMEASSQPTTTPIVRDINDGQDNQR